MTRKTTTIALVAASLLIAVGSVSAPTQAEATGLVKCDQTASGSKNKDGDVAVHSQAWDPIVFHNVDSDDPAQPQPHLHDFFGNTLPATTDSLNDKTYTDLRSAAGTSCRLVGDTASYWAPALVCTKVSLACAYVGQRIGVRQFSAYYRGFASQSKEPGTVALPAGARLVATQSAGAGGKPGYGLTGWTCGANSTVTGGQDTIPDCSRESGGPGRSLTAHINFPSCWNGMPPSHPADPDNAAFDYEYGDTRDNDYGQSGEFTSNDFVYPTSKKACPPSHPIEVVQLRETIAYSYTGDGTDVALSSDHGAAPGSTMHVDFWNTWDQDALTEFVERCVQQAKGSGCSP